MGMINAETEVLDKTIVVSGRIVIIKKEKNVERLMDITYFV